MNEKSHFLISSIEDIQGIIRAIDNKLIAIIVLILLPVSKLESIVMVFNKLIISVPFWGYLLLFTFVLFWLLSLLFSFLGILGIENPKKHIYGSQNLTGYFYNGNMFKISFYQTAFSNRIKTQKSFDTYYSELELSKKDILKELVFEQLKLSFIRNLKMRRQKIAIVSILISTIIGLASWTFVLIKIYNQ
jgi:hypothetical protein